MRPGAGLSGLLGIQSPFSPKPGSGSKTGDRKMTSVLLSAPGESSVQSQYGIPPIHPQVYNSCYRNVGGDGGTDRRLSKGNYSSKGIRLKWWSYSQHKVDVFSVDNVCPQKVLKAILNVRHIIGRRVKLSLYQTFDGADVLLTLLDLGRLLAFKVLALWSLMRKKL